MWIFGCFLPFFWPTSPHQEVKKKKIIVCLLNNQTQLLGSSFAQFAVFVEKRLHHCVLKRMLKVEGC